MAFEGQASSQSKHAYVFFRESGNRQLNWRRQEMKFAKLHPFKYQQVKRTVKTEQEWREKFDAHIVEIYKDKHFNLTKKQKILFTIIRKNDLTLLTKVLIIPHCSLEELLVKDIFWTKLNPLSSHQPDISEEIRQIIWEFVVANCGDDTLALVHWAIRLHLPTQNISDLIDQLAV